MAVDYFVDIHRETPVLFVYFALQHDWVAPFDLECTGYPMLSDNCIIYQETLESKKYHGRSNAKRQKIL